MSNLSNLLSGFLEGVFIFFVGSFSGISIFSVSGSIYYSIIGIFLLFATSYLLNKKKIPPSSRTILFFSVGYVSPFIGWAFIVFMAFQNFSM
jgi:glucose dehydrogenase